MKVARGHIHGNGGNLRPLTLNDSPGESVTAGVYYSQTSVFYFCLGFTGMSLRFQITVLLMSELFSVLYGIVFLIIIHFFSLEIVFACIFHI